MAFPTDYTRVWVVGRIVDLTKAARGDANTGITGPITFTPSPNTVLDGGQILGSDRAFVAYPAATDGFFKILLPATNDPDVNPTGWTYAVVEPTGRKYNITVPYNTPTTWFEAGDPHSLNGQAVIDLYNVVPNPDANPGTVQTLEGVPGRGVATLTVDGSGHLTGTYSNGATWDAGSFTKSSIGLGNVDNTSDANKPVSTAQAASIATKADAAATTTALAGKAASAHAHAAADVSSGNLAAARLPIVPWVISATSVSTNQALATDADSSAGPMLRKITLTANVTSVDVPTDAADGQVVKFVFYASGGSRTVTFASGIRTSTGLTRGAHTIPSGEVMIAALEYSALISAWVLTAYTFSAV